MPQVEAGAAGVPVMSVDYSAMNDVVHKLKGYPIKVNQYFKEMETRAIRVYPDNNDFVRIVRDYLKLPDMLKQQKRHETRQLVEKYYNWDDIAKKWENYLDNIKLVGIQGQWDKPLSPIEKIPKLDDSRNPYDNVVELVSKVLPNHQICTSKVLLNMIRDLDYGFTINGMQTQGYDVDHVRDTINNIINNHNTTVQAMANPHLMNKEDFIEYANMKDNTK